MSNRKPIFDWLRDKLGRGVTQAEVNELDTLLDSYEASRKGTANGWAEYAVPLVQSFEGFARAMMDGRVQSYPDPATGGAPWTIGWGSTGPGIEPGTVWTKAQAEERFRADLSRFANGVEDALDGAATTDRQFAALVSLAYNVGLANLKGSTLLRLHKAGDYAGAAAEFARWNRAAGKVLPGLTRRREAEAALYRGDV